MGRVTIELATQTDNQALQRMLLQNPMDGHIRMTFQRQPDFFKAALIGNEASQTIIARDRDNGEIVGLGTRAIRSVYVNGAVKSVGYLCDLRVLKSYRNGTLVARGYQYCKKLHNDEKVDLYVTTIAEENQHAIETLIGKRAGLPEYRYFGAYRSYAISILRKKSPLQSSAITIMRGSSDYIDDIVACLNRNGAQKQFYPYYRKEDFILGTGKVEGFRVEDLFLATESGKVIGVVGAWDQRKMRQIIIAGYAGSMRVVRPLYNLGARIMRFQTLPEAGEELRARFLSFIAIDDNRADIFEMLLRAAYNSCVNNGSAYLVVGLHSCDSLSKVLSGYHCVRYTTNMYVVTWDRMQQCAPDLDDRIPYLEAATL